MKPGIHRVLGTPLAGPWPDGTKTAIFGLGCFWGDEKDFWQLPGVVTTAVGYAGGHTPNPTYEETCTGRTGHAEVVLVAYDPTQTSYEALLKTFWEHHDPTQGMRQGNDHGTSYRSIIIVADDEQRAAAEASKAMYQEQLSKAGYGTITTEIVDAVDEPVLLRRGLPPAVPRQEPARLLPEPRDRREAAGRLRGHAAAVRRLARPFIITPHEGDAVRARGRHRSGPRTARGFHLGGEGGDGRVSARGARRVGSICRRRGQLRFFEVYADEAAYDAHLQSPHFRIVPGDDRADDLARVLVETVPPSAGRLGVKRYCPWRDGSAVPSSHGPLSTWHEFHDEQSLAATRRPPSAGDTRANHLGVCRSNQEIRMSDQDRSRTFVTVSSCGISRWMPA